MSASDPPAPGADDWNHEATSIAHHEERTDTDFTVNRNQQETSVNTNNHHPKPEEVDDSENNYNDPFFVYRGGNQRIPADVAMVRIDPSVTVIPSSAFAGCAFLTIVEMHPQVTAIEALAFSSCASLEQIHLSHRLQRIGEAAFSFCSELSHVELPSSLEYLGERAFSSSGLETVRFVEESPISSLDDYEPKKPMVWGRGVFDLCLQLTTIRIPARLQVVADQSFLGCERLTYVQFEKATITTAKQLGCKRIGDRAFAACSALQSIEWPDDNEIAALGIEAFDKCKALRSIRIPRKVTHLPSGIFAECESLSEIAFATKQNECSLRSIARKAFRQCTALETIHIPPSVRQIGEGAFEGCRTLQRIDLGEGNHVQLTTISRKAFFMCLALEEVSLPYSVVYVGDRAFELCASMRVIRFPSARFSMGGEALVGCKSLCQIQLVAARSIPLSIWHWLIGQLLGSYLFGNGPRQRLTGSHVAPSVLFNFLTEHKSMLTDNWMPSRGRRRPRRPSSSTDHG